MKVLVTGATGLLGSHDEPVTQQDYFTTIAKELGVSPPGVYIPQ